MLERYPAHLRPSGLIEALGNAGGFSGSQFWRFQSQAGRLGVRRWPDRGPTRERIERVHRWLQDAADLGFIPVPFAGLDGRTVQDVDGKFWELVPWLPGRPDDSKPPPVERVRPAFAALARFHQRLSGHATLGVSPAVGSRLAEVERLAGGGLATLRALTDTGPADAIARLARRWADVAAGCLGPVRTMLNRARSVTTRCQPCLRDARPGHFLFEENRVSGLVDFGAMDRESVAADLARLAADWLDNDPILRLEAFQSYEAVRPIDLNDDRLIRVLERSADLLTGGQWAAWHYVDRRAFEDPTAVVSGLTRGVERVESLAARVRAGGLD